VLDYFETLSPIAKFVNIRNVFAVAAIQEWHVIELDENNASTVNESSRL